MGLVSFAFWTSPAVRAQAATTKLPDQQLPSTSVSPAEGERPWLRGLLEFLLVASLPVLAERGCGFGLYSHRFS